MENEKTLREAIDEFRVQGYTEDFNLNRDCLKCERDALLIYPDEFQIDQALRFDVDTDPADQAILYAISSRVHHRKGLLVNGYGRYTEELSDSLASKLHFTGL